MIEVGELKRLLDKFPDNYLAMAVEDDESNYLGIFKQTNPNAGLPPEPIGYIGMMTWDDAAIFVGDGNEVQALCDEKKAPLNP